MLTGCTEIQKSGGGDNRGLQCLAKKKKKKRGGGRGWGGAFAGLFEARAVSERHCGVSIVHMANSQTGLGGWGGE